MIYNYKGQLKIYNGDKWENLSLNGEKVSGFQLKLVERQESDENVLNEAYRIELNKKLKPNNIYVVTYYSGMYGDEISTMLPISSDGRAHVRAVVPADGGTSFPGKLNYNLLSNVLYFNTDDYSLTLDPITKLEIYELTSGDTQTEDEVIKLFSSDVSHNDELDIDGLDLRKPGKYYIYDDDNLEEIDAYFGYTSDGKYPKYVFYSNILTGATACTRDENDGVGQLVTIAFGYDKSLYIEVTDRTVHIYNLFEI